MRASCVRAPRSSGCDSTLGNGPPTLRLPQVAPGSSSRGIPACPTAAARRRTTRRAAATPGGATTQVSYVLAHWSDRNTAQYGSLGDDDCVNFASQSLIARGWPQTADWWHRQILGVNEYSAAWVSSTAFRDYLSRHPELAEPLANNQRSRVVPGDIVQFDWDDSGNRDHTGVVTRVVHSMTGIEVYYASHSNDREDESVDAAIALDGRGGTAYFWHLLR
jgi:hypothetical protein